TGKFPDDTLENQYSLVTSFLRLHQPLFTWNGDTSFWRSAASSVGSALNLLWKQKRAWTMDEATTVTSLCFELLANVGKLLPDSTVGLSPTQQHYVGFPSCHTFLINVVSDEAGGLLK